MKSFFAAAAMLLSATAASAQTLALASPKLKPHSALLLGASPRVAAPADGGDHNNEVKINLLSLALFNFSFQYERALTPHLSAALGVRFGPERGLPFSGLVENIAGVDNDTTKKLITDARLSNYAFTPEIRYYFGKRNISGFYMGLFGRFGSFNLDMPYTIYDPGLADGRLDMMLKGSYAYGGAGLQLGTKFRLSDRLTLDWSFFGPMFTTGNLKLDVQTDLSNATAEGKAEAQRQLRENFDEATVDDNGIRVSRSLLLPGYRTSFSLGFRF